MDRTREFILVTGATSRIGEAVARRIGATESLVLHGRDIRRLETLRESLPNSDAHLIWPQDFAGNSNSADNLIHLLSDASIVATGFVHCAQEHQVRLLELSNPAVTLKALQVNYLSATSIIRVLLKKAVNRGALRTIVFVSSIASRFGANGNTTYAATKGALDSLSRSLAVELGPAVRVNSILPGELGAAQGYLAGPGRADDVAALCEFLLSDSARWITGQQFVIDGGKTAH